MGLRRSCFLSDFPGLIRTCVTQLCCLMQFQARKCRWGRRENAPAPKPGAIDTRCLIEQGSSMLACVGKDPFRGLLLCVILSTLVLGFLAAN